MRFFALETNKDKIVRQFCHDHDGECVILITRFHGLSFLFRIAREILITTALIAGAITAWALNFPMAWTAGILTGLWFVLAPINLIKAYIDWVYDFIIVTTDKVILVDQTSIFKREVMPIHVENIGGISAFTQLWNIFPFGGMSIHLKEGRGGEDVTRKFVPNAQVVAGKISDVITKYQRHQYRNGDLGRTKAHSAEQTAAAVTAQNVAAHQKPSSSAQPIQTPAEATS